MSLVLADKSAFGQHHHPAAVQELSSLTSQGRLAMCEIVALELLYSARSANEYEEQHADLSVLPWLAVDNEVMRRALDVQRLLAGSGQHRRPIPDLIVAATAEVHDATVLHYDKDFDLIAEVTGQPVRWIIPRGIGH